MSLHSSLDERMRLCLKKKNSGIAEMMWEENNIYIVKLTGCWVEVGRVKEFRVTPRFLALETS